MRIPDSVQAGQDIKASTINGIIDCLKALWPGPSGDVFPTVTDAGTTYSLKPNRPKPPKSVQVDSLPALHLYIKQQGNATATPTPIPAKISVTDGWILAFGKAFFVWESLTNSPIVPVDMGAGEALCFWLKLNTSGGNLRWDFTSGAAYPSITDHEENQYIPLGEVTTDGTTGVATIVARQLVEHDAWGGGNICFPTRYSLDGYEIIHTMGTDGITVRYTSGSTWQQISINHNNGGEVSITNSDGKSIIINLGGIQAGCTTPIQIREMPYCDTTSGTAVQRKIAMLCSEVYD